ncbi:winged helix-turn-helix transcriptional regulator [Isoptericola chiayiensis]|uniref:winged helix-turn-helix transcriptional regulator n=1 Tax=Isoptericola chiayiensis TaxID=579446 RepID=UPI001551D79A|nr:DNA-binding HxlR family transcriptional regulator [Isoptericola chiayiensis]
MREAVRRAADVCPIEVGVAVAGGDWKLTVVSKLEPGPLRFGALQRAVGPVSAKTLTRQLRALETDGIVTRTVYAEVPPRVTYALTAAGAELAEVARALGSWGERYLGASAPVAPASAPDAT